MPSSSPPPAQGDKVIKLMTVFQVCSWTLCIFAYTVGAGISGRQVLVVTGHMSPDDNLWPIMLVFGAIECVISQLPSLNDAHWSSAVGAFMSMGYSLVTLGLCAAKAYNHQGTIGGIPDLTPANRAFGIMNSLGAIAFAYSFSAVLMEIEDTIKDPNEDRPPAEALPRTLSRPSARNGWVDLARASRGTEADSMGRPRLSHSSLSLYTPYAVVNIMKRAVLVSLTVSYLLYISVAITGYMAFGNSVNGQVLATPNLGPVWAVVLGNVMVFAHMISAVQVFSQPFFVLCEGKLFKRFPDAFGSRSQLGIRLVFRTSYVALCTFISCLIPFFIQIMGLVGAIVYWPITVLFPILMWLAIYPHKWFHAAGLQTVNVLMALVAIAAATGSVRLIITNASSYTLFKN